mmetsp:Transcript_53847/g.97122  ORF Transcript_53847/g.97122 Transcript_53847/m.97122 type:complete len:80 (-) Transcript_53847:15-254(-)
MAVATEGATEDVTEGAMAVVREVAAAAAVVVGATVALAALGLADAVVTPSGGAAAAVADLEAAERHCKQLEDRREPASS